MTWRYTHDREGHGGIHMTGRYTHDGEAHGGIHMTGRGMEVYI